jgi:hypothetical protein
MKIKKLFKYYVLGYWVKDIEIQRIKKKVSDGSKLNSRENSFLEIHNIASESDNKDYMLLSKSVVSTKILELIKKDRIIICDLHDRDGKIGLEIVDINNNYELDTSVLILKGDIKHNLHDKFLYNLIYNIKKNQFSLQEHDEYYEKIEAK